jgi:hypothetical protein
VTWCGSKPDSIAGDAANEPMVALPSNVQYERASRAVARAIACAVARLGYRFGTILEQNPKKTYGIVLLLLVGSLFMPYRAQPQNLVDGMVQQAQTFSTDSLSNAVQLIGIPLFLCLSGITIGYAFTQYAAENQSVRGFMGVFGITFLNLFIPFAFIGAAPTLIAAIPGAGTTFGSTIFGISPPPSISSVAETGTSVGWALLQKAWQAVLGNQTVNTSAQGGQSILRSIGNAVTTAQTYLSPSGLLDVAVHGIVLLIAVVVSMIILLCFAMVAVELLMAYLQFYLTMPAAAWILGFYGSPVTAGNAAQYWNVVIRALVRFVVILGVIDWMLRTTAQWGTTIAASNFRPEQVIGTANGTWNATVNANIGIMQFMLSYLIAAVILAIVVRQTPAIADAALSGSPAVGGTGAVLAAKAGVGGMVGGFIGGATGGRGGGSNRSSVGGAVGAVGNAMKSGAQLMEKLFESGRL